MADAPGAIARLNANELPQGAPPSVWSAVLGSLTFNRYADPASRDVVAALASHLRVHRDEVLLGAGSSVLLQRLIRVLCPRRGDAVMWATPGFDAIDHFIRQADAEPQPVPLTTDGSTDLDAMLEATTPQTRVVILVSPHNPTGTVARDADLRRFLERIDPNITVVLDEAYAEFVTDPLAPDGIELARECWNDAHRNVVVVRTMSKAHGLAALRIGYGAAPPEIACKVWEAGMPRELGSLAQTAALAALRREAQAEMRENVQAIIQERSRVTTELRSFSTVLGSPSQANFVWLPVGDRAEDLARHCNANGVQVLGIASHGVRVTIGARYENDAFLRAVRSWTPADARAIA